MALSAPQLETFRREGLVFPLRALDAGDAATRAASLLAFAQAKGRTLTSLLRFKAHLRLRALEAIARHPAILDAVEAIIGPDFLVFTSTVWAKAPGDRRYVSWHQDSAYFGLDPHDEVTAWVALTDSRRDNGCLRAIPGSHREPDYAHDETRDEGNLLIRGQTIRGLDENAAVDIELEPGEFSLHAERTVHGSLANDSSRPRVGYAIFYIPPHVRSTLGRRTDAIAVEGFEAAMDRMNAYLEAGADIAFVEAPRTVEELAAVPPRLSKPALANVFEGGKTPQLPAKQLESMGYRLGIYPSQTHRAAIFAAKEVLEVLKREGTTESYEHRLATFQQREEAVGSARWKAIEDKYLRSV